MAALPQILAGPILRRCDHSQVNIWLATSQRPNQLGATIYSQDNSLSSSSVKTIKLGEQLYVSLITATPLVDAFPADELLNYDLHIDDNNLQALGLLSGNQSLAYPGQSLPSFFIPSASNNPILHGSCRKLHGEDKDALAIADHRLAEHVDDLSQRPSALFLTGDQIYADDVAAPLIKPLCELAEVLCPNEPAVAGMPTPLSSIKINKRHHLMKEKAAFTSGEAHNHMISFGEFSALYLLAWNGQLWPAQFEEDDHAIRDRVYQPFRVSKETLRARAKYRDQLAQLQLNHQTLSQVRRLLANIPSYMIFDDHEVTDDWNISPHWLNKVNQSEAGSRIINNALAAYWVFQGWGNDPANDKNDQLLDAVQDFINGDIAQEQTFNQALSQQQWSYLAPTHPPALVLDTRTRRNMNVEHHDLPWLMDEASLNSMSDQLSAMETDTPLIIVSAAPVVGLETIEEAQATFNSWGVKADTLDFESWSASGEGLANFLKRLHGAIEGNQLLFLSGDVHYSFNMKGSFSWQDKTLHFKQLTSSAQKNTGWANKTLMDTFASWDHHRSIYGWDQQPTSQRYEEVRNEPAQHLREVTEYRNLLSQQPVILSDRKMREMEIVEPYDWAINSEYLKARIGDEGYRIIGCNNIGCLSFGDDGGVRNILYTWRGDEMVGYGVEF